MPKARKSETVATKASNVNATPSSDAPAKKQAKASKKAASQVVSEPVVNAAPVEPLPVEVTPVESSDVQLSDIFIEFMSKLQAMTQQMNLLKTEFRNLERKAVRELKTAQKFQAKRKRKGVSRQPSGFVKPTLISDELAQFLKKPSGTEMARTEVTREINGYIRAHSLQDKENGRKINPDSSLATLLKMNPGDELTYFNLQRYMSPHFAKAGPKAPTSA